MTNRKTASADAPAPARRQSWRDRIGAWLGVVFIPQAEEDARLADMERSAAQFRAPPPDPVAQRDASGPKA